MFLNLLDFFSFNSNKPTPLHPTKRIFLQFSINFLHFLADPLTEMRHRKLFPVPATTNQSEDCPPDFCDPSCPYNCYPYPDSYFLPPPPSPPPPPFSAQDHHLSPYVIILITLLGSFFLLVSYYVIIAKSCSGWCGWRNNRQPQDQADSADEEFVDENRVDHPIWFIATIGLQQSIINSITVCRYKKGEGLIEGTDCSVCLNEFQEHETLRLLPKCNHAFHISCIDTWLRSHTNCPLCRARIVSDPVIPPLALVEQNSESLSPTADTQMERSEIDRELGDSHERDNEISESGAGTEEGGEIVEVGCEKIVECVNSNANDVPQLVSNPDDSNQDEDEVIQPVSRSVSLDSLSAANLCLGLSNCSPAESEGSSVDHREDAKQSHSAIIAKRDVRHSSMFRLMGRTLIAQRLHKGPVSMKRSFSCGGRFFLSRQNRSLNSILPL